MCDFLELPLRTPIFSTYHYQTAGTAVIIDNPSIENWYLNNAVSLICTKRFLEKYTSPEIDVENTIWHQNPHIETIWISMKHIDGAINRVIHNLLNQGHYVHYFGVDDYYIKGKSWYHERHFDHDGLLCGYNDKDKTYCIYAYDDHWICRKFWILQQDFYKGQKAMAKKGAYGCLCAVKPHKDTVEFSPSTTLNKIREYINLDIKNHNVISGETVRGIAVHNYIAKYIDKLYDGSIPYEKMDRRVFRLIWEHKKVMLKRISYIEHAMGLGVYISDKYMAVVNEADDIRMLYAVHHMRRRDSVLPVIKKKLLNIKRKEKRILNELCKKVESET